MEQWVDGNLIAEAMDGNHCAVREMARICAAHMRRMSAATTADDDATPYLAAVLDGIAAGQSPDEAFRWRGKKRQGLGYLNWCFAQEVERLIDGHGMSPPDAVALVGEAAHKGEDKGGTIDKAYRAYLARGRDMPDDLYPIPPGAMDEADRVHLAVERIGCRRGHEKHTP